MEKVTRPQKNMDIRKKFNIPCDRISVGYNSFCSTRNIGKIPPDLITTVTIIATKGTQPKYCATKFA